MLPASQSKHLSRASADSLQGGDMSLCLSRWARRVLCGSLVFRCSNRGCRAAVKASRRGFQSLRSGSSHPSSPALPRGRSRMKAEIASHSVKASIVPICTLVIRAHTYWRTPAQTPITRAAVKDGEATQQVELQWTAKSVRQAYLDFFTEKAHEF
eukprot:3515495-Amphidinium_carterae.1